MLKTPDHSSASHPITQGMNKTKPLSFCSSPFPSGHQLTPLLSSSASPQEISLGWCARGGTMDQTAAVGDERGAWLRYWPEGCTAMFCPWGSPCSEARVEPRFHEMAWAPGFHFHAYCFSFRVLFSTQFIQLEVMITVNIPLKNIKLLHGSKGMSPNLWDRKKFLQTTGTGNIEHCRV